jgi:endoglucanase
LVALKLTMHFGTLFVSASTAGLALAAPSEKQKRVKNFQFFGINESGAEFGNTAFPGQLNKDYTWPVTYVVNHESTN